MSSLICKDVYNSSTYDLPPLNIYVYILGHDSKIPLPNNDNANPVDPVKGNRSTASIEMLAAGGFKLDHFPQFFGAESHLVLTSTSYEVPGVLTWDPYVRVKAG